jgi:hypothetical protein
MAEIEGRWQKVGRITRMSVTEYYEMMCSNSDPHPQHLLGASGSGGGGVMNQGPLRGERTVNNGTTTETWCPGIRGMMQV